MLLQKIKTRNSNTQELNISKEELFKNIYSEISESECKFYNVEKSDSSKRDSNPKRESKIAEVKVDRDFFSRVNKKKNRKEDYKSSTLKMFR